MSNDQRNLVASFTANELILIELHLNFAEGPHSHLSAACEAHLTGGGVRRAYPRHPDIIGVYVIDGENKPDSLELDLRAIDTNIERLVLRAYPYRAIVTLSSLELYSSVTSFRRGNTSSGISYSNTYKPESEVFQGVDWYELVRHEVGNWELFALAGSESHAT